MTETVTASKAAEALAKKGLEFVRLKARSAFVENRHLTDSVDIKKAIAKGRYWVRELNAVSKLAKYRAMKRRY